MSYFNGYQVGVSHMCCYSNCLLIKVMGYHKILDARVIFHQKISCCSLAQCYWHDNKILHYVLSP